VIFHFSVTFPPEYVQTLFLCTRSSAPASLTSVYVSRPSAKLPEREYP
jgi:hypothetical protein